MSTKPMYRQMTGAMIELELRMLIQRHITEGPIRDGIKYGLGYPHSFVLTASHPYGTPECVVEVWMKLEWRIRRFTFKDLYNNEPGIPELVGAASDHGA